MSEDTPQGRRLRDMRKRAGLTQKQLAEHLKVSVRTVRNWESGRTKPALSLAQYRLIARLLGVPLSQLPDSFKPETE